MRQRSVLDLKRAKQGKSPWSKIDKKPGLKKANKVKSNRLTTTKKIQLAASGKGSWYNQPDVVL